MPLKILNRSKIAPPRNRAATLVVLGLLLFARTLFAQEAPNAKLRDPASWGGDHVDKMLPLYALCLPNVPNSLLPKSLAKCLL